VRQRRAHTAHETSPRFFLQIMNSSFAAVTSIVLCIALLYGSERWPFHFTSSTPTEDLEIEVLQPCGAVIFCSDLSTLNVRTIPNACDLRTISNATIDTLKQKTFEYGHVVLRNFESLNKSEMIAAARRFGDLLGWNFGYLHEVRPEVNPKSSVESRGRVPLHWDGMFYHTIPSFQLFQCVKAPDDNAGGRTTFVHTVPVVKAAPEWRRRLWRDSSIRYFTPNLTYFGGFPVSYTIETTHKHLPGVGVLQFHEPFQHEELPSVEITPPTDAARDELVRLGEELMAPDRCDRVYDVCVRSFITSADCGNTFGNEATLC
jgi:hypothetical protein